MKSLKESKRFSPKYYLFLTALVMAMSVASVCCVTFYSTTGSFLEAAVATYNYWFLPIFLFELILYAVKKDEKKKGAAKMAAIWSAVAWFVCQDFFWTAMFGATGVGGTWTNSGFITAIINAIFGVDFG